MKIKQIAALVHHYEKYDLKLFVWRYINKEEKEKETGTALKGPLPEVACKLTNAIAGVVRSLILNNFLLLNDYILNVFECIL